MGRRHTAAVVQSRAYWPTLSSDLDVFMRQCEPCARYHRGNVRHQVPMQTPMVGEPWERVSIDITGPHLRSARGNQYILTLIDHFSKWGEAVPLVNHTAPTVARALLIHVFSRFGTPRQLLSDRGPEFESALFGQLMRWLDIDKLRTTPYKPSTNGAVERFHRMLNSMLARS
jgi:transposase InsO family protein